MAKKDMASYLGSMAVGKDDAAAEADSVPGMDGADDCMDAHDCIHMLEHGSTPDGKHKIHPDDHAMMKKHMEPMYQSMHDALDENGSEYETEDDHDDDDQPSYNHTEDNQEE